jgi:hypothetical protein
MRAWLESFAWPFLQGPVMRRMSQEQYEKFLDEVEYLLAPSLQAGSGAWVADYVRLRFKAVKLPE